MEFFGDFLYWQTTEPVDWVLNTNRLPVDQFVNYETIDFNSVPGFRVGVGREGQWGTKFYYTWLRSRAAHRASGNLTPTFLGGKLALSDAPAGTPPYFDLGQVEAAVDYNVLDWDFYKPAKSAGSLRLRPVFGLKGAWINQAFDSAFQGQWPDAALTKSVTERIRNRFWGIGPKIGLESGWNVWQGEKCKIRFTADFSTAYLLGHWTVTDVADLTTTVDSVPTMSRRLVPIAGREFGALTFQATVGIHLTCRRWSAMAGYELNDWLNQCQLFDDATGPHNNDLLLQGLTARLSFRF
ncbi:MAG: hypothetical protein JW818_06520 [Pirellulales bacterium]|nr:hypothetical protein [Pirellulales bacterium]